MSRSFLVPLVLLSFHVLWYKGKRERGGWIGWIGYIKECEVFKKKRVFADTVELGLI